MSQTNLSHNLDKIIQMISIEQLLGLMKQLNLGNNNTATTTAAVAAAGIDVKSVINAYEAEITTNSSTSTNNNELSNITSEIQKIHSQLENLNNSLSIIINKISILESKSVDHELDEEHITLTIEEKSDNLNDKTKNENIIKFEEDIDDDVSLDEAEAEEAEAEEAEAEEEESLEDLVKSLEEEA